jgi:hypothetical protein
MIRGFAMTSAQLDGQATAPGDSFRVLLAVSEAIIANRELATSPVLVYRPTSLGVAPRAGETVGIA